MEIRYSHESPAVRRTSARLRRAARLRLLPAVFRAPGSLPALPRATRLLLRDPAGLRCRRLACACRARKSSLLRCGKRPCAGRRRSRRSAGLAAASPGGSGTCLRSGPVLHDGELPARAAAREGIHGLGAVRGGKLALPRALDSRVVAGLVRGLCAVRALAGLQKRTGRALAVKTLFLGGKDGHV